MDISSLSAAIQVSPGNNGSVSLTTTMIKLDAEQQGKIAGILAQNTQAISQSTQQPDSRYQFSRYA